VLALLVDLRGFIGVRALQEWLYMPMEEEVMCHAGNSGTHH